MTSTVTGSERCDACGSQAFAKARKDAQVLFFCGHHVASHRVALSTQGWQIVDECDQIYVRPNVHAHA